jgi:large subunit ribosomal protein L9
MEVILLEDVEKLGTRGKIVRVADGYGRNYLLPKKLAVAATAQNRKWVEQQRVKFLKLEAKEKAEAEELAKLLQGATVAVQRKAGEKGTLFGSVTAMDVAERLAAQGFNIDKRRIHLDPPLKVLGEYEVPVKLHADVTATIKVKVESEGEPEAAPPAPTPAP